MSNVCHPHPSLSSKRLFILVIITNEIAITDVRNYCFIYNTVFLGKELHLKIQ